ncbi:MAG: ATPase, T2SS/T4P/T4SS family, partial [Candidatus Sigynarchaeota archaeon]
KLCTLKLVEGLREKRSSDLDRLYIKDPVEYIDVISNVKKFLSTNPECAKCMKTQEKEIDQVLSILTEDALIKRWIKENQMPQDGPIKSKPFDLLNQSLLKKALSMFRKKDEGLASSKEIDRYHLADSTIIEASISQIEGKNEKMYHISFHLPFTDDFFQILKRDVRVDLEEDQILLKIEKFEDVINRIIEVTRKRIEHVVNLEKKKDVDLIVLLIGFSMLGFEKLFPLLIDENIEEIFLDSPDGPIYIHHIQHQYCRTTIFLISAEIQSVISRLRMETDKNLNELFPSLKCVIKNDYFYTRINVDVKPLNPSGFSLDIRRLNKKLFDIIDLIRLGTFNIEIAAFLVFCLHSRRNLTIIGKTDSGKTTLLNALDMLYPQHLRKIYVEDEIETVNQDPACYHQLKFKTTSKERKSDLIKNLLHRSPEVLILGEILTKEETEAMFHCLSTGMRGLQTIHASVLRSLITRLRIHFNISPSCFEDLDFIILLKKFENGQRKLVEIAECNMDPRNGEISVNILTSYNAKIGNWSSLNFGDSRVMGDFFANTRFSQISFNEYLEAVKMVIGKSLKGNDHKTPDLVKELNQVYMCYRDYF